MGFNFKPKIKFRQLFQSVYKKLFIINDTPQRIALGMGLGVFSGILPGTGPLAALFLAFVFRVNRASALFGSLLTNTWLSFVTFIFAVKVGADTFGLHWQKLYQDFIALLKDFNWISLFKVSIIKIILPVITGYIIISFGLGLLVYLLTLIIIYAIKIRKRKSENKV